MIRDEEDGGIIVGIVSPRKASTPEKTQNKTRLLLKQIQKVKPNQKRGEKNGGINEQYSFFGHRKDPLKSGTLSEYVPRLFLRMWLRMHLKKSSVVADRLEMIGHTLIYKCDDHKDFMAARDHLALPTIGRRKIVPPPRSA